MGYSRRVSWRAAMLSCPLVAALTLHAVPAGAAAAMAHPARWPAANGGIPLRADVEEVVERLLLTMTLEEKVGQMLQADISTASPEDVRNYGLGSVLAGGSSAPKRDLRGPAADWLALTRSYGAAADTGGHGSHPPIPLLFGIDAVHGHGHARGATIFPHNVALGAAHDPDLVRRIGQATAVEVRATGVDWVFAPTVAVAHDARWGRAYESYSDDPTLVASYASSIVSGLQGTLGADGFLGEAGVLATLKHFIGDGGTRDGRDQGQTLGDERTLVREHAAGYSAGIQAGAMTVMASYSSWQGRKMHGNGTLLTDVLKRRMGFNGFVIGDWNGHEQVPGCTKYDCPAAIVAGVDMVMAADGWKSFRDHTLAEARNGTIPSARIDDAVRRILRVKVLAGLFAGGNAARRANDAGLSVLGAPEHRALAREAVRRSLVLLKNEKHVLPLSAQAHVLVAGAAAEDIGLQAGGWTIDWQGDHNSNADFPGATSIFGGIRAAMTAGGGSATWSRDGSYATRPDAAVVVFGERPYAEYDGDREDLLLPDRDEPGLQLIRRLRSDGIPVIAVLLSGRPLWMNRELNAADAFVVAWLPGTEGEGVADALIGTAENHAVHDFSGRLPFPWPSEAKPVQVDRAGRAHGQLYARGYGLTYAHGAAFRPLPERSGVAQDAAGDEPLFAKQHVIAPWNLYVGDWIADQRVTMGEVHSETGGLGVTFSSDGLNARWRGGTAGDLLIAGRARDWSPAVRPDSALQITYRVRAAPVRAVHIGLRCGLPYGSAPEPPGGPGRRCGVPDGAMMDYTETFRTEPGAWHTLRLPLKCFTAAGADLRIVGTPLVIRTDGEFALTIRDARLVKILANSAACNAASTEPRIRH